MPTGDITALSDDDAPVLQAAPAGGSGKAAVAAKVDDDDAPVLPAAPPGKKAAATKAKAKATAAKPAAKPAAAKSEKSTEKPATPKAKSKAKSNAKSKSKAKASPELTDPKKDGSEGVEVEDDTTEEPAPRKRPAAKLTVAPVEEEEAGSLRTVQMLWFGPKDTL